MIDETIHFGIFMPSALLFGGVGTKNRNWRNNYWQTNGENDVVTQNSIAVFWPDLKKEKNIFLHCITLLLNERKGAQSKLHT